jgi:anti-sigma regulatory factor (Ser/Thr protein kinase)
MWTVRDGYVHHFCPSEVSVTVIPSSCSPDPQAWAYSVCVPHDARAGRVARAAVRAALEVHELPELIDRAVLVGSELLANALVHTDGEAQLRMKWAGERLRLTVWDTSPKLPDVKAVEEGSESGRGLYLVQMLADRWGYYPLPVTLVGVESKVTWCELSRRPTVTW